MSEMGCYRSMCTACWKRGGAAKINKFEAKHQKISLISKTVDFLKYEGFHAKSFYESE